MAISRSDLFPPNESAVAWTGPVEGIGEVCVREITGDDFDFVNAGRKGDDTRQLFARLIVVGVCDPSGRPLFKREQLAEVNAMKFWRLKALAGAVQDHSGITSEDAKELEGNLPATTPSGSGTD